jgi:hypothetical protein
VPEQTDSDFNNFSISYSLSVCVLTIPIYKKGNLIDYTSTVLRITWDCLRDEKKYFPSFRDTAACRDLFMAATAVNYTGFYVHPHDTTRWAEFMINLK